MSTRTELFDNRPYMFAYEENDGDGNRTTYVETGPAMVVFPLKIINGELSVLLIEQNRPDADQKYFKSIGGYVLENDDILVSIARNSLNKAGVELGRKTVLYQKIPDYPTIMTPVTAFIADGWKIKKDTAPGCKRVILTVEEAIDRVDEIIINNYQEFNADICTSHGLLTIARRYQNGKIKILE